MVFLELMDIKGVDPVCALGGANCQRAYFSNFFYVKTKESGPLRGTLAAPLDPPIYEYRQGSIALSHKGEFLCGHNI